MQFLEFMLWGEEVQDTVERDECIDSRGQGNVIVQEELLVYYWKVGKQDRCDIIGFNIFSWKIKF